MASDLDVALAKIRPHTTSSVPHQKAPASLLNAIEATFTEQHADRTPAAYFAALITTLDSTVQKVQPSAFALGDGDLLPAELYLLALVLPYVPPPVVRTNFNTLLSLTAPLWPALNPHAPPLRSQLSVYDATLQVLDRAQLDAPLVRQSFATILQLCIDPRPKVRRRAADLVRDALASPPSPMIRHPYADRVAEWTLNALTDVNAGGLSKHKGKKQDVDPSAAGIHLLAFLRPILPYMPSSSLPLITTALLSLPRLGNPYLSQSAYLALADLLANAPEEIDDPFPRNVTAEISDILKAILASVPSKADTTLLPSWVQVAGKVMLAYAAAETEACALELPRVWKTLFPFLESADAPTRKETAAALACLAQCFSPQMVAAATAAASSSSSPLGHIIAQATKALDSVAFVRAIPELLSVVSSLIQGLRRRPGGRRSPTAAELLLLPLIHKIGELRVTKGFECKEGADGVLKTAMSVLGPEVLLRALPLNLEPADRAAGKEPRAFLLPLLTTPHPAPLAHFVAYFVPLTERMFDLQQKAEDEGRAAEAKVWSVLVAQIWNGLPAYCRGSPDLKETLTPQFAQMLSQLLYTQPELRAPVIKALIAMVQSNLALSAEARGEAGADSDTITPEEAAQNIAFLRTQAESWFAVLFNVFGSAGRDAQGPVGEAISVWAAITNAQDMTSACRKVVDLFCANVEKAAPAPAHALGHGQGGPGGVVATMQDILVLLVPHLPPADARAVFELTLSASVLANKDGGVQKRGYKLLGRLVESGKVEVDPEAVLGTLEEVADDVAAAAKKERMNLIKSLLPHLPSTSLHVIPSLIPEAILGTKEPSEKARTAAFDLVVEMGNKMSAGGTVKRRKLFGMDEDTQEEANASVEEYLTMIAGGLAGASPHMISATVTAISRLVFEFKDSIPASMHTEIFTTLLVFLSSKNREIVKSTLGFIKLAVHTLPVDLTRPHLPQLVPALLAWAHDHKNHFKEKVRHVFERMIRRFGWEDVYACAAEDDAAKFLMNIKKRKDRAKRKRAQNAQDEDDVEDAAPKPVAGDAFEDVLYGSESEGDESDDEPRSGARPQEGKKKGKESGARLRIDDDEPMDLLQGATTRLTSGKSGRRKPGQDAGKFKTDEETGKMVIDEDSDSDDAGGKAMEDVVGTAYRESIMSVDGFTRGPNGRVKFNKDTKKRRRGNEELDDVEMVDAAPPAAEKKSKRRSDVKLGREFKAKNAGGDVKKGGVDPYAYLPLSQAAKKGHRKGERRVTITGKR